MSAEPRAAAAAVDPVRQVADAVLYEGYVLWPYRRSAIKNQQRFTFGGIYPRGWPEDRSAARTECLVECDGDPALDVRVRFLHVVRRQAVDAGGRPVDEVVAGGERHLTWDEVTERELAVAVPGETPIDVPAGTEAEELDGGGRLRRSWEGLSGTIATEVAPVRPGLLRVSVEVANRATFARAPDGADAPGGDWRGAARERVLRRTLCSAHVVLRTTAGAFVSATDPPAEHADAAAACRNDGLWPVLAGDEGSRETVLAAPIVLEDHPRVAPESPGDLFDGGEIDKLLTLNVLALTDEEKDEMRATDPRAREILERSESLTADDLMRLHGTLRDPRATG